MLSVQSDIEIDIAEMTTSSVLNDRDESFDYSYDCIIDKNGKLSLANLSDTLDYSVMQKFIYYYFTNESIGSGIYKASCIEIEGRDIPVNSYLISNLKSNDIKIEGI